MEGRTEGGQTNNPQGTQMPMQTGRSMIKNISRKPTFRLYCVTGKNLPGDGQHQQIQ